jgi:hypothetical protein
MGMYIEEGRFGNYGDMAAIFKIFPKLIPMSFPKIKVPTSLPSFLGPQKSKWIEHFPFIENKCRTSN